MEFRTKREAEEAAKEMDGRAIQSDCYAMRARAQDNGTLMLAHTSKAEHYRVEAARLRALLPTLPE